MGWASLFRHPCYIVIIYNRKRKWIEFMFSLWEASREFGSSLNKWLNRSGLNQIRSNLKMILTLKIQKYWIVLACNSDGLDCYKSKKNPICWYQHMTMSSKNSNPFQSAKNQLDPGLRIPNEIDITTSRRCFSTQSQEFWTWITMVRSLGFRSNFIVDMQIRNLSAEEFKLSLL